ncbi:MAG: TMEM165/GDT1 family protein [Desulfonatronovibrionaceae bacterium]
MDIKLLGTTFLTLFLAELGDKTQLACILLTAKTQKPATVFIGASLALVLVTLLGVTFANIICNYIPGETIRKIGAAAFILLGILMFADKI